LFNPYLQTAHSRVPGQAVLHF